MAFAVIRQFLRILSLSRSEAAGWADAHKASGDPTWGVASGPSGANFLIFVTLENSQKLPTGCALRGDLLEGMTSILRETPQFPQETLQFLQGAAQFMQETPQFLQETPQFLQETLQFLQGTAQFLAVAAAFLGISAAR